VAIGFAGPLPPLGLATPAPVPTVGFLSPLGPLAGGTAPIFVGVGFVSLLGLLGAGVGAPVEPPSGGGGGRRPRRRPERLPVPEPIIGTGAVRAPLAQIWGRGRVTILGRGVLVGEPAEVHGEGTVTILGRGAVRTRRAASSRGTGRVGVLDDDIFGLELEEMDLELT
jgi:hypothetical protein